MHIHKPRAHIQYHIAKCLIFLYHTHRINRIHPRTSLRLHSRAYHHPLLPDIARPSVASPPLPSRLPFSFPPHPLLSLLASTPTRPPTPSSLASYPSPCPQHLAESSSTVHPLKPASTHTPFLLFGTQVLSSSFPPNPLPFSFSVCQSLSHSISLCLPISSPFSPSHTDPYSCIPKQSARLQTVYPTACPTTIGLMTKNVQS